MAQKSLRRNVIRMAALASASLLAFPAVAQAAETGPVKPMYGKLRPFYGKIRPFYGNLRPFYGKIRPFWGNLRPFWGDTGAFYGEFKGFWGVDNPALGAGAPQYGAIGEFWTVQGGQIDTLFNEWGADKLTAERLKSLVDSARTFWGASVEAQTGRSFDEAFANQILVAYGIDPNNPASLAALDQDARALFFLEWYDGLMGFAGTDRVDHWMKTANWSPALTQQQSSGPGATVGLLDMTIVGDSELRGSVIRYDGVSNFTDGHGVAVGSLIVGAHDGKGVMGIAPNASVVAYNPFDETGTAGWADVTQGVRMLKASGAGVVNMSLGVPGKTFDAGWNSVFASLGTTLILKNTVFVLAAGNEGVTQTQNVNWSPLNPAVIIVGSVDVDGNISNFSNRPGEACLSTLSLLCLPGSKLKDRFIVAPGEMILVSDGNGGVTRQIGTSFAAPLVSGAIALIHDRWPWLVNSPHEVADIIFKSAKDLGAPGVDGVYGHGLLDIAASQSPLDFNRLTWYTVQDGKKVMATRSSVLSAYRNTAQSTWDAKGAYFYAFEPLGLLGLIQRDFAIPLSSKLVGQSFINYQGSSERFQAYLLSRMDDWAASATNRSLAYAGSHSFAPVSMAVPNAWGADMSVTFAPRTSRFGYRDEGPAYQSALRIRNERSSVVVGFGDGAPALAQNPHFDQGADYDAERSGTNPLLGLASGGAYAGWTYGLTDKLSFTAGALARDEVRDTRLDPALGILGNGAERYSADAQHLAMTYKPNAALTLTGGYSRLHEGSGLLGVQSLDPGDFAQGSVTDGVTIGLTWQAGAKLSFAASGTLGRTRASDNGQALQVDKDGLTTSAFEIGVAASDLLRKGDVARFSLAQPMHVERGKLAVSTVRVIDRQTGEIGIVTESFGLSQPRRLAAEVLYAVPVSDGRGDVALFGRAEGETSGARKAEYLTGGRYRIAF